MKKARYKKPVFQLNKSESGKGWKYLVLGVLGVGGAIAGVKIWHKLSLKLENKKAAEDEDTNIASKIHAENRATWTSDDKQISLYRQVADYKATSKAYKHLSGGKDMLEDTRKHVSSGSYQQILNILGIKGGAIKASSDTAKQIQTNLLQSTWVVAKVDTRIRKSPVAGSAVFNMQSNILGTAKIGNLVGLLDKGTLHKNKGKLFYDDKNGAFFLPVLVFDNSNASKYYPAFVAIANVQVLKEQPKNITYFTLSKWQYDQTSAFNGID